MSFYFRYVILLILWAVCLIQPLVSYAASNDNKSILIISSYNPAAHQTTVTISDFMDEYHRLHGSHDILIENMNCKSFSEAPLWKGIMSQILSKYRNEKTPELIILLGQEAWAAYLSQDDSIVGKVPVMCSLASRNAVILPKDTTSLEKWMPESVDFFDNKTHVHEVRSGFLNEYNVADNIRLIKYFYPDTRHIAFISDNTYGGVTMQALVRKEMKAFPDMNLILLDGRTNTIYTIVDKLRELPAHTAVLIGTWRVDMNEGYFMRNATYAMMEANPGVPTFSMSSVGLGYWAVGGVVPSYRSIGGEMAQEVMRMSEHPEDTISHISLIGSKAVLDSKKMKELSLDVNFLPFKVEIVNQPPSFYQQYKYQIWGGSVFLFLLISGLCISLFFYFRTKRLKDELQHSERDLREAKDRAEESNRLKSAFLANMSHEIRTPLNSIVGFSNVLAYGGNSEEERKNYYTIIQSNSDLLLRLINDILDLSRLEADRVTLTFEECDVVEVCSQTLASVSFSRQSSNKFVFTSVYENFRLRTDVQRMQQVIINLLSNADKFTKEGIITLEFSVDKDQQWALFSVTDTGCGIPKEKQKLVFERFEKLNEYAQGTGLGLSICTLIVNKWGGGIWIDPEYSGGARFVFSHPLNIEK